MTFHRKWANKISHPWLVLMLKDIRTHLKRFLIGISSKFRSINRTMLVFIYFILVSTLSAQIFTKNPELVKNGSFIFGGGQLEYVVPESEYIHEGYVNVLPFTIQLGLAKRTEFFGVFPWIMIRPASGREREEKNTLGDIIVDLKFNI